MIPETISHYRIVKKLGAGGMGEVYLAHDIRLGRSVALKRLTSEATDPKAKQRFLQEARSASALNHPGIVTIHSIEEADGLDFIVMEYVEGDTLKARIEQGPLPLSQWFDLGAQLGDALAAAHTVGLIHRDIKPSNILITPRGQAKLLDFGLAKTFGAAQPSDLTTTGGIIGTISYMSPEQTRGEPLDARSDIFSLGSVLYEAATGELPFKGPSALSTMHEIAVNDPEPPSVFRQNLPRELESILRRMMAKDREERYASASEVTRALTSLKGSTAESESETRPTAAQRRPEVRYARSNNVNIAYQVVGDGPLDLVYVMGWVSNVDSFWEEPLYARFLHRLATFSRLIVFDKRGTGLSDRVHDSDLPTLEQRMDDVRAVMDAAGSHRAVLLGVSEGGPMCALFAATYPERTAALILYGSYAKRVWDPEYPWAPTPRERQKFYDEIQQGWGGPVNLDIFAPSVANDERFKQWWSAYLRRSASPGAALALARMNTQIDIRHILPAISVPTLILHRSGDLGIDVRGSRYMAERIPGARYVELPGQDHLAWVADQEAILREVQDFVRDIQEPLELDRVLATVMLIEIIARNDRPDPERREILERHRQLARRDLERFRGRAIQATESRLLATFDGPARAIRAARAICDSARWLGIEVRAGLHTGECLVTDEAVTGLPLEIAARVAAKAGAGEILVSGTVRDLVAGSGIRFADRGSHILDGEAGRWPLFAVEAETDAAAVNRLRAQSSGDVGDRVGRAGGAFDSLAILPLVNGSGDPGMEYVSDGITESIINRMSQLPDLRVMAWSTVSRYRGRPVDPQTVGRELGVQALLTGKVLSLSDSLVIGIELVNLTDGSQLWGEQYKRQPSDILMVQEEIASDISDKLRLKLTGEQKKQLVKRQTRSADAYRAYLMGRYHWNKRSEDGLKKGIEYFKQAIEEDPAYSLAYVGLADSYNVLGFYSILPPKEAFPRAKSAALRALEIDDGLAEAHNSLAYAMFYYDWDCPAAEGEFHRAIELNPQYATSHQFYGGMLTAMGRWDEALREANRAQELDPLSLIIGAFEGWVLYFTRRFDESVASLNKALELDGQFALAHLWLAVTLVEKSMFEEAIREYQTAMALSWEHPGMLAGLGHAYAVAGREDDARKVLDRLTHLSKTQYVSPYRIAGVHVGLGEQDRAFEWLEQAYLDRSHLLVFLRVDPQLDPLRSDSRFADLVKRVGIGG